MLHLVVDFAMANSLTNERADADTDTGTDTETDTDAGTDTDTGRETDAETAWSCHINHTHCAQCT